tara:strand:- start:904 stop:1554 length:651 start_codon:yes stop_codon:yes gene_type:complete
MSYLAEVHMPEKELDDVEVSEIADEYPEEEEEYSDDEGVEEERIPLPPPPEKKVKLKKEDIFRPKAAPPKKVKVDPEPKTIDEPIIPTIAPVKKKRQLSEKQKEALKKGREARMKKKEAAQAPEPAPAPAPTIRRRRAPAAPQEEQKQVEQQGKFYTPEDLEEMVFKGVTRYDTIRKARKAKKQAGLVKENHEKKVFSDINSALSRQNDPYANLFT